jgi:beta-glucanase (GH16 family)
MQTFAVKDHADSFLPEGKTWKLVWQDEFDGTELDRSKWGFRLNFWGQRFKTYTEEGVELDGQSHLKLHLIKKGDDYYSPHLQTGSLTYDIPKDSPRFWPFGKMETPRFMHRYGYYEIRCKLPKNPGWHAAFWLQAPGIGSHPDARFAGVECDVMENYRQHTEGKIIGGNIWGGYGKDCHGSRHFQWDYQETADGWHYYGVDWSPAGYYFYADGRLIGRVLPPERAAEANMMFAEGSKRWLNEGSTSIGPVSEVEQFILVSTECHGYRGGGFTAPAGHPFGTPAPILSQAVLPDWFEVDHVRVFDEG